jgi:hypothetical protein
VTGTINNRYILNDRVVSCAVEMNSMTGAAVNRAMTDDGVT